MKRLRSKSDLTPYPGFVTVATRHAAGPYRSFARLGDTDQAMRALETAVAAGWSDAPDVATSPDLVSLQGRPGWRRLLERMAEQAP